MRRGGRGRRAGLDGRHGATVPPAPDPALRPPDQARLVARRLTIKRNSVAVVPVVAPQPAIYHINHTRDLRLGWDEDASPHIGRAHLIAT
mgnify:CR=1 FL=1